MGAEGAEEDEGAAIYILLDGYDTMGIGYIALWGFGAKSGSGWMEWMDTPQTVTTTRAPAVLKTSKNAMKQMILSSKIKGDVLSDHFLMLGFQKVTFVFLNVPGVPRLEICQEIYTTKFSGERILHTENA